MYYDLLLSNIVNINQIACMPKTNEARASYHYKRNFRNSGLISLDPRTVLLDGILLLVLGAFSLAQAAQPVNLAGDT